MAAPSPVEIANLKAWSLYRHYFRRRARYIGHGKAVVAGNRAMLQKALAVAPAQLVTLTVTEDDIAAGLLAFLGGIPSPKGSYDPQRECVDDRHYGTFHRLGRLLRHHQVIRH